jgi:hypothetical protein
LGFVSRLTALISRSEVATKPREGPNASTRQRPDHLRALSRFAGGKKWEVVS